jgi:O-antigen ligase
VAVLLVWVLFGGDLAKRLKLSLLILIPITVLVLVSPMRDRVINLIPFIGQTHAETVTYRQDLFWVAIDVIMAFPVLGPPQYYAAHQMQSMVQGEGIIDIVNSFIGLGLDHGLVGVGLFFGAFLTCAWYVVRTMRSHAAEDDAFKEAAALLAALAGVLITIATVSSIGAIPMTYWMLAGLCVAHFRNCALPRPLREQEASHGGETQNARFRPQRGW